MIRCHLHRSRVDANRDLAQASFGNSDATLAWQEYHQYIDDAKTAAASGGKRVLYIDLHGQVCVLEVKQNRLNINKKYTVIILMYSVYIQWSLERR